MGPSSQNYCEKRLFEKLRQSELLLCLATGAKGPSAKEVQGEKLSFCEIMAPKFWERSKGVFFLAQRRGLSLEAQVAEELLNLLGGEDVYEIDRALGAMALKIFPQKTLTKEHLLTFLGPQKTDVFELADLFTQKNLKGLFSKLLGPSLTPTDYRSLFAFLLSHGLKLLDPAAIEKKTHHNRYEKSLLGGRRNWSEGELRAFLRLLAKWEVMAKIADPSLRHRLRLLQLKYGEAGRRKEG